MGNATYLLSPSQVREGLNVGAVADTIVQLRQLADCLESLITLPEEDSQPWLANRARDLLDRMGIR